MQPKIVIRGKTRLAEAWGRFDNYHVTYTGSDGVAHQYDREVYDHGVAAAVLMYDPDKGDVVLVRQWRLPPQLNGDVPLLLEVPAGMIDADEAPEAAAHREAVEETGYEPADLELVFSMYPSPGALTEKVACFLARYTTGGQVGTGGGLKGEGEEVEVVEMPLAEALTMVERGGILDGKTIMLLQALALRQAR